MDDRLYDRQQRLNLNVPDNILIVGAGGVGSWVAIYAAMSGVKTIYIADPDKLEMSNFNRLPFCIGNEGQLKVDVLASYIRSIREDAEVITIPHKIDIDSELRGLLLLVRYVVDCTDSPSTQIKLSSYINNHYTNNVGTVEYIRAGYDGTSITVASRVSGWIKESEQENYAIEPSWVVPASIVGAMAVAKMCYKRDIEVATDIKDIGISVIKEAPTYCPQDCPETEQLINFRKMLGGVSNE